MWRTTEHVHCFNTMWQIETAPIKNGQGHTNFFLQGCENCKIVIPFPLEHYGLVTEEYKESLRNELKLKGWNLAA